MFGRAVSVINFRSIFDRFQFANSSPASGTFLLPLITFLLNRPQVVIIGGNLSSSLTLSTGTPQYCVLSPMLDSLSTYDCASCNESNQILKCAYDTTAYYELR